MSLRQLSENTIKTLYELNLKTKFYKNTKTAKTNQNKQAQYSQFCIKIPTFSLPWLQGSVCGKIQTPLNWSVEESVIDCYTCQVIDDLKLTFSLP